MYTKESRERLLKGLPTYVLGRLVSISGQTFPSGINKFFLEEEHEGCNKFLQEFSAEKLEDIRDKLAPHLKDDSRYSDGLFPYCDTDRLVIRIIEYVLATYCPGEISTKQKPLVKRGNIVMKPRKKDVF